MAQIVLIYPNGWKLFIALHNTVQNLSHVVSGVHFQNPLDQLQTRVLLDVVANPLQVFPNFIRNLSYFDLLSIQRVSDKIDRNIRKIELIHDSARYTFSLERTKSSQWPDT